jgi:uncharacterized protein (DUF924 family)
MAHPTPNTILGFWKSVGYDRWFKKDAAVDAEVAERFRETWKAASAGALDGWAESDEGALALTIVLDQFARNLFRDDPCAFSTDAKARTIASQAIARGADSRVDPELRQCFYLPFMHSEELADQERSVALYRTLGEAEPLKFAILHRDIIAQFGRFPHRNPILGRAMTPEEQAYLDAEGFKG